MPEPDLTKRPALAESAGPSILSRRRAGGLLLGLCLVQFALLITLTVINRRTQSPTRGIPAPRSRQQANQHLHEPIFYGKPGPWGELKYIRIAIEWPDEFLPLTDRTFAKTQWHFPGWQSDQLKAWFDSCTLTPRQHAELTDINNWIFAPNDIVITPSPQLILELEPSARVKIYSVLAESEANPYHRWPFTCRADGFNDWFQNSDISPDTVQLVKKLLYPRGPSLCFSDLRDVIGCIPGNPERQRLLKTLSRNPTLLMKLQITPDADVEALTKYWGQSWRTKDIRSLLESLTKTPGMILLDVVHLLPPFARKRLNSYPHPDNDTTNAAPDCFWTAFKIFPPTRPMTVTMTSMSGKLNCGQIRSPSPIRRMATWFFSSARTTPPCMPPYISPTTWSSPRMAEIFVSRGY